MTSDDNDYRQEIIVQLSVVIMINGDPIIYGVETFKTNLCAVSVAKRSDRHS